MIKDIYKEYCTETFDSNGILQGFDLQCPKDFNFAYDIVDRIAKEEPDRRAMMWCDVDGNEREFTFEQMSKLSNQAANYFLSCGIQHGDCVMLILKRHYEYWYALLGLHKIGAIGIPATHLLTVKDIVYRVHAAGIKAVVATNQDGVPQRVLEAKKQCSQLQRIFVVRQSVENCDNFSDGVAYSSDKLSRIPVASHDPMLTYFTSGTTGYPKMVVHDFTYPLAHIITAKYWQNIDPDGLHLTVSETGWAKAAWGKIYGQWILGGGIMVYDFDKFIPYDLLHIIEKYRVTSFCAPPTIYRFFIKEGMGNFDLSSLKYATIAGEALNLEVFKRFKDATGLQLMEAFGQTETTVVLANLFHSPIKPGSMGKPSPLYEVDLVDENGNSVAPNEVGEIVIYPKDKKEQIGIFRGYHNDPALNEFVWRGGCYHMGDTAYRDEDGYFWYVGRVDDIIKSSGYRIGPFEIESVLMEHPAVLECGITGVPDEIRGQVVKATIVLTSAYKPSDELAKDIQDFVKKSTAPYKYPRVIEFVDELPKTISGKIRRNVLRNEDTGELQ